MATIEMKAGVLVTAAAAIPEDCPVVMVNLLRYKERADYGGTSDLGPCSGREAYFGRYLPAFAKVAAGIPFKLLYAGTVFAAVAAPAGERWDDVAVVEYPSLAAFRRVVESAEYAAEAAPHRRAALEDWRLVATVKMELPG